MPLVRIDVLEGRSDEQLSAIGNAAPPQLSGPYATFGGGDSRFGIQIGNANVQAPVEFRPRPLLRFDQQSSLLVSGLLDGGADIAGQTAVVDVPVEKGHYLLFANNPIYRGETIGSYFMVFNALLSFDSLSVGRK